MEIKTVPSAKHGHSDAPLARELRAIANITAHLAILSLFVCVSGNIFARGFGQRGGFWEEGVVRASSKS